MGHRKSLVIFVAVLFAIGIVPYLTQDVFAASPTITAYIGNDPDDGDTVYGAGDTLTITTDIPTNATVGAVTNAAFVTGNFTFAVDPLFGLTFGAGNDWTAAWADASTLVITILNTGANTPVVGVSTVDTTGGNTIGDQTADEAGMTNGAADVLSGDFGLFVAVSGGGGGCTGDCNEPTLGVRNDGTRMVDGGFTYNGKSIDVERYFTPYPLITVQVGKQNTAEFKIFDNQGPDSISHLELAFGLANGESIGMSKAVINWDRTFDGIETVTLDDSENVLDKVKVTTSEGYCSDELQTKCLIVKVTHTFRAPLNFDILATNVWDLKRNAWQNYYNHGIEIVGESLNPPKEYDGIHQGKITHLFETGKGIAVDEQGNTWTFDKTWKRDYIPTKKIIDGTEQDGINRNNAWFNSYKYGQELVAKEVLEKYCTSCSDKEFAEINDIFSYEFPTQVDKLLDSEIQKKMLQESKIADNTLQQIFDSLYGNHNY